LWRSHHETQESLTRAQVDLPRAEHKLAHLGLNNCMRSAHDVYFQVAVAARLTKLCVGHMSGRPPLPPLLSPLPHGGEGHMGGHDLMQARFAGPLIQRYQRYPVTLRETLTALLGLRPQADDRVASVSQREAAQRWRLYTEKPMGYVVC
jgi:hypothetical protein